VLSIVTALSACPLVGIRAVENLGRPLFEGHPCFLEFLNSKKQRSDPSFLPSFAKGGVRA
jgi:hypothetical protein